MGEACTGTTEFREVDDYIEDVDKNNKSIVWADCSSDEGGRLRGSILSMSAVGPAGKWASAHSRRPVVNRRKLLTRIHEMKLATSYRPCDSERAHKPPSGGRYMINCWSWQRRDGLSLCSLQGPSHSQLGCKYSAGAMPCTFPSSACGSVWLELAASTYRKTDADRRGRRTRKARKLQTNLRKTRARVIVSTRGASEFAAGNWRCFLCADVPWERGASL